MNAKTGKTNGSPAAPPEEVRDEALAATDCVPRLTHRPDEDVHAWLCQRITMIQSEQQSRWQKILNMIPGQLLGRPSV